jgi:hypothetical protein
MKYTPSKNETVNQYINNEVPDTLKELFIKLREAILSVKSDLDEDIKWKNCLTYAVKKNMIQTVVGKEKVSLIFFEGAQLNDPNNLLEGDGKKTRTGKFSSVDFDAEALKNLVKQAIPLAG